MHTRVVGVAAVDESRSDGGIFAGGALAVVVGNTKMFERENKQVMR